MLKKLALTLAIVGLAAVITGCASVSSTNKLNGQQLTATGDTPIRHVNASNWGLYLLWIPLLTGDTKNVGSIAVLKDTVNLDNVVDLATKESKKLGATKTTDLQSSNTSMYIFPVFFLKETQVSGNALK